MASFITFEGIEGSGKTTQLRLLGETLDALGYQVLLTREPGGCPIADQIRGTLLHPDNAALVPRAELLLYAAARAQHVEEVVNPALEQGKIVLCDRFTDATLAYQGDGRGLDRGLIVELNRLAAGLCTPDLTLLFDLPAEIGLGRALKRETEQQDSSEGRFERETLEFHQRIRAGYLKLAAAEPERFSIIDADQTPKQIAGTISELTENFLAARIGTQ